MTKREFLNFRTLQVIPLASDKRLNSPTRFLHLCNGEKQYQYTPQQQHGYVLEFQFPLCQLKYSQYFTKLLMSIP